MATGRPGRNTGRTPTPGLETAKPYSNPNATRGAATTTEGGAPTSVGPPTQGTATAINLGSSLYVNEKEKSATFNVITGGSGFSILGNQIFFQSPTQAALYQQGETEIVNAKSTVASLSNLAATNPLAATQVLQTITSGKYAGYNALTAAQYQLNTEAPSLIKNNAPVQVGTIEANGVIQSSNNPVIETVSGNLNGTSQNLGTITYLPTVTNGNLNLTFSNFQPVTVAVTKGQTVTNPVTGQSYNIGNTGLASTSFNPTTGTVSLGTISFFQGSANLFGVQQSATLPNKSVLNYNVGINFGTNTVNTTNINYSNLPETISELNPSGLTQTPNGFIAGFPSTANVFNNQSPFYSFNTQSQSQYNIISYPKVNFNINTTSLFQGTASTVTNYQLNSQNLLSSAFPSQYQTNAALGQALVQNAKTTAIFGGGFSAVGFVNYFSTKPLNITYQVNGKPYTFTETSSAYAGLIQGYGLQASANPVLGGIQLITGGLSGIANELGTVSSPYSSTIQKGIASALIVTPTVVPYAGKSIGGVLGSIGIGGNSLLGQSITSTALGSGLGAGFSVGYLEITKPTINPSTITSSAITGAEVGAATGLGLTVGFGLASGIIYPPEGQFAVSKSFTAFSGKSEEGIGTYTFTSNGKTIVLNGENIGNAASQIDFYKTNALTGKISLTGSAYVSYTVTSLTASSDVESLGISEAKDITGKLYNANGKFIGNINLPSGTITFTYAQPQESPFANFISGKGNLNSIMLSEDVVNKDFGIPNQPTGSSANLPATGEDLIGNGFEKSNIGTSFQKAYSTDLGKIFSNPSSTGKLLSTPGTINIEDLGGTFLGTKTIGESFTSSGMKVYIQGFSFNPNDVPIAQDIAEGFGGSRNGFQLTAGTTFGSIGGGTSLALNGQTPLALNSYISPFAGKLIYLPSESGLPGSLTLGFLPSTFAPSNLFPNNGNNGGSLQGTGGVITVETGNGMVMLQKQISGTINNQQSVSVEATEEPAQKQSESVITFKDYQKFVQKSNIGIESQVIVSKESQVQLQQRQSTQSIIKSTSPLLQTSKFTTSSLFNNANPSIFKQIYETKRKYVQANPSSSIFKTPSIQIFLQPTVQKLKYPNKSIFTPTNPTNTPPIGNPNKQPKPQEPSPILPTKNIFVPTGIGITNVITPIPSLVPGSRKPKRPIIYKPHNPSIMVFGSTPDLTSATLGYKVSNKGLRERLRKIGVSRPL